MARNGLNATAASLLGLLHEGPLTGWDLVARAQTRLGDFWTVTQSQVYRELATMATEGLVEVGPSGPRDRKPHTITPAGRAAFSRWLAAEPPADHVRIPMLLVIAFASHLPPGRLDEMVQEQRSRHLGLLTGYRETRAALGDRPGDPARMATLEYGLRHEQAVLDWLDALPAILGP